MKVDLHNHTTLCNHATGTMEQYVEQAIKQGTDIFGFSDHAPMDFDTKYRMGFDDMMRYEDNIKRLKDKYQDKIEILSAYEVDFMSHVSLMDSRVLEADVDYLIGSVHFIDKWGFDNPEFIGEYKSKNIDEVWHKYFDTVVDMVKSGLFDIVGHMDLIKVFKFFPDADIGTFVAPVLKEIQKSDMTVELNSAGYRKPVAEPYPSTSILKKMYEMNIPITFGADAHSVDQVALNTDKLRQSAKDVGYTKCTIFKSRTRSFVNIG